MPTSYTLSVQGPGVMRGIRKAHTQTQEAWLTVLSGGTWPTHPRTAAPHVEQTQTKVCVQSAGRLKTTPLFTLSAHTRVHTLRLTLTREASHLRVRCGEGSRDIVRLYHCNNVGSVKANTPQAKSSLRVQLCPQAVCCPRQSHARPDPTGQHEVPSNKGRV